MGQAMIGLNRTDVLASTSTAFYRLGTVGGWDDPNGGYKEYLYVHAAEAITGAGYLCIVDSGYEAEMVDTTSTAPGAGVGCRVGAAQAAVADNEYFWIQIYGKGSLKTLLSAALGTRLNSTATAGQVDDDGTSGAEPIMGLTLGTATDGSATLNTDAYFNYPFVGVTI